MLPKVAIDLAEEHGSNYQNWNKDLKAGKHHFQRASLPGILNTARDYMSVTDLQRAVKNFSDQKLEP